MERAAGIEPVYSAWKADVLPLNYARSLADHTRFELVIFSVTGRHVRPLHQWSVAGITIAQQRGNEKEFVAVVMLKQ